MYIIDSQCFHLRRYKGRPWGFSVMRFTLEGTPVSRFQIYAAIVFFLCLYVCISIHNHKSPYLRRRKPLPIFFSPLSLLPFFFFPLFNFITRRWPAKNFYQPMNVDKGVLVWSLTRSLIHSPAPRRLLRFPLFSPPLCNPLLFPRTKPCNRWLLIFCTVWWLIMDFNRRQRIISGITRIWKSAEPWRK